MADYFVKNGGSDANNGSTWALAKATILAGMNLCGSAGDRCVVAPGVYYEVGITPPSAGSRGNNKVLYGDWGCAVADGGGLFSGAAPGYVTVDSSVQSGNKGRGSSGVPYATFGASNNWAYWDMKNFFVCGGGNGFDISGTGSPANDGVTFENLIIDSGYQNNFAGWIIDPDAYSPVTFRNCVLFCRRNHATLPYNVGLYFNGLKSTSYYTNPQFVFERSVLVGIFSPFYMDCANTRYTYAHMKNCSLIAIANAPADGNNSYGYSGASNTYAKVDVYDSYVNAQNKSLNITVNETRVQTYFANNLVASTLSRYPVLPFIPYLFPQSPLVGANSGNGVFPDLFGVPIRGNADYGAQELVAGVYPKPPTMRLQRIPGRATYGIGV